MRIVPTVWLELGAAGGRKADRRASFHFSPESIGRFPYADMKSSP
ncbi:hypothetical protein SAMCFNEI73_Ch2644 [Sinorhizobium americanum]|uniref:Uncharacterized protein n=1 Tax=Sinorhizobium americanum TaxID=194963 RepID=A0A1L3LP96_9HYPH|nr:hypothetical protein SAMCCGM7_Ch2518 [Sinorhizobium americanum CCGM7]APG91920.1 hypothetical protein SAMCFNEI73_Ch2644 [Sinorhizobium americanum]